MSLGRAINMMKRQGDLLVVRVDMLPSGALIRNSLVLAEGEATGHKHQLTNGEVYEKDGQLYFCVAGQTNVTLTHQEHQPLIFTPGIYKVIRQKEYEPGSWHYVDD